MTDKRELIKLISSQQLMEYTREISKEVRLSGSLEEKSSFEYAQSILTKLGYQTSLYYRKALISLPESSDLTIGGHFFDSITHSMSVSTDKEGLEADLVYIGDEEYESCSSIKGKAVLINGLATPGAVQTAQRNGAVAAIFINAEYTHEMIVSTVWGNPSLEDIDMYPKISVASVTYNDGQKIIEMLSNSESNAILCLKTSVSTEWKDIPTLIADYTFNPETKDFLLFSGHIDSWHYGAMDNGTADATILECARVLQQGSPKFKRNIRLAFWSGHSHGRYAGSALYADENFEELYDHCLLHLNIDSVGGINSTVLTAGNTMAETKQLIGNSVKLVANQEFEGSRFGRAGDQSFWGAGIPSALMGLSEQEPVDTPAMRAFSKLFGGGKGGGFGWWWHTTEDTLDKIDPELLKRDCKIYLSIVYDFCSSDIIPIQQTAALKEIISILERYKQQYDFKDLLNTTFLRLEKLEKLTIFIESKSQDVSSSSRDIINEWTKQMSRSLVQINYVDKDIFTHDSAISQGPVPSIANILSRKNLNEVDSNIIHTTLQRKINKINFSLKELLRISENTSKLI
ncbi:M28 family metallopeptidase [Planococcus sp. S3-L1]|uniref:M28 family metallopeptidase n=1 Tax=Planococcus sp. S3-L1 TaxID=3046200 RepID=UPI0024BAA31D|nr:M28 family metallopeptidase [Planococcus sp. S3-L1]MDJ0332981.1 M28 family peptidase [Planococcus sp. S3-L1]